MSYQDLSATLSGMLPGLSPLLAGKHVQSAWRDIRDSRLWSFFLVEDSIATPAQITAGTLAIVQFTNTVTADATASAAIAAVGTSVEIPYTFLSFRFGGPGTTSQIYNIVSVDSTVPTALVFTLDRVIMEATAVASGYICYRPYIAAPQADFLKWDAFIDMVNGWDLNKKCTSRSFDVSDPQRQAYGQAYNIGYCKASDDAPPVPVYELWPGPTEGQTFYVRYQVRGVDFSSPTDVQPYGIPDQLIIQWALGYYSLQWAQMNAGHFPAMAKVNWAQMIEQARQAIHGKPGSNRPGLLQAAIRQDDNQATRSVLNRGHGLRTRNLGAPFPIDANFIQSHLVSL